MPYNPAKFAEGTRVRIAARAVLEEFLRSWKLHNKLKQGQLPYAGQTAEVEKNYMYHGGYILYELKGIPGLWHEQCLESAGEAAPKI
jgi:hypothetical protein